MKKIILIFFTLLFLTQCVAVERDQVKKAPPPWAPAHGHRAKHRYYYYPSAFVYFDIDRKVYFYLEGSTWRIVKKAPSVILSAPDEYVVIDLDTDKPYIYFDEHKRKYPPGQFKKYNKKHPLKKKHKW